MARKRETTLALIIAAVLLVAFVAGFLPHHLRQRRIEADAERRRHSLPSVNAVAVKRSPGVSHLVLPGTVTPITEALIYARASGYVRRRYVDIGDRVKAGQVLADIDAPELDQQVAQGGAAVAQAEQQLGQTRAALEDSRARLALAQVTYERYRILLTQNSVSRQDTDQQYQGYQSAQATVTASEANVAAAQQNVEGAQANLRRLRDLQRFEQVRAPFDGIVTVRNFDIGALVSASGGTMSGPGDTSSATIAGTPTAGIQGGELFHVAQIERLRVMVTVPQDSAPAVRVGTPAKLQVQEFANHPFPGVVTRTANALDPGSRTMLTEIQVDNPSSMLLPGIYAQVTFESPRSSPPLLIPGDAVITRANGTQLAVLVDPRPEDRQKLPQQDAEASRAAKRVELRPVQIGRDYGNELEIVGGLQGWEHVIVNPSDQVYDGALVVPRGAPSETGQSGAGRSAAPSGITSPSETAPQQGAPDAQRGNQPSNGNGRGGQPGQRGR